MQPQILPVEQIENKLKDIANKKQRVMVRISLFGGVEICVFGLMTMDFDTNDACPFFTVQHPQQYVTTIRFYGTDVKILRNTHGVPEILLGN